MISDGERVSVPLPCLAARRLIEQRAFRLFGTKHPDDEDRCVFRHSCQRNTGVLADFDDFRCMSSLSASDDGQLSHSSVCGPEVSKLSLPLCLSPVSFSVCISVSVSVPLPLPRLTSSSPFLTLSFCLSRSLSSFVAAC